MRSSLAANAGNRSTSGLWGRVRAVLPRLSRAGGVAAIVLTIAHPLAAHEFKVGDIEIVHPWSRAVPAGAEAAEGYFILKNSGASADRLLAVTGEIAGRTDIHAVTVNASGVMTMRPFDGGLEIPAGGEVVFKPDSSHIMFLDLKSRPAEGAKFKGTLTFEKAGPVDVEFAVDKASGDGESPEHKNHGG